MTVSSSDSIWSLGSLAAWGFVSEEADSRSIIAGSETYMIVA